MLRAERQPRREPCAICDATHSHQRLCAACKADPANVDWTEDRDDTEEFIETRAAPHRLGELQDIKLRPTTALAKAITDLVARGLWERHPYYDKHGRRRGTRMRHVRLSYRRIARILGCSHAYVRAVLRKPFR